MLGLSPRLVAIALTIFALAPRDASAVVVWVIDDGERIARDAGPSPLERGEGNPVWQPGAPVKLLALRDEVVALQALVRADGGALDGITVDVTGLDATITRERFVEHYFPVRRSATGGRAESLGWALHSGPPGDRHTGLLPDALIPVEIAPAWAAYPLQIVAGQTGAVWIDLTVPRDLAPATYRGAVVVRQNGQPLASLPLELEVLPQVLPARPVATMLFYDRGALRRRVGPSEAVVRQLWTLFHRHRVAPLHGIDSAADVRAHLPALDGTLYGTGPAAGVGDGIVVLGTYGTLGDPAPDKLARVEEIAAELDAHKVFDRADVILYAEDEVCASPRGAAWKKLLASSTSPAARRVRVAWTCSDDPARQPVDVPMVGASAYDPALADDARAAGKETWIYGGWRPATGTILTDTEAVSTRSKGWIAALAGIPRWFLWETTFWYDGNRGGRGPYDPFASAETFHNLDGEASMGDGVLVYPGRQIDRFGEHSLGFDGVVPSIRLKNLRRGIQDAGYYQLARAAHPDEADRIARALLPRILGEARPGEPPSWSEQGKPWFDARVALARLLPASPAPPSPGPPTHGAFGRRPFRARWLWLVGALPLLVALYAVHRRRRLLRRQ